MVEPVSTADNTAAWLASAGLPMLAGWILVSVVIVLVCWAIIVRFAKSGIGAF
jgi:hypothetical protein